MGVMSIVGGMAGEKNMWVSYKAFFICLWEALYFSINHVGINMAFGFGF